MKPSLAVLVSIATAASLISPGRPAVSAAECPERVDGSGFTSEQTLAGWNEVMASFGARPTASPAHEAFVDWLDERFDEIDGLTRHDLGETIDRWLEESASLTLLAPDGAVDVPVSGAVPYTAVTDGLTAPVVYLPPDTPIADADVAGKIVVRDVVPGTIPLAVFLAVAYYVHDPAASFDWTSNYERDWVSAAQRITDLQQAGEAGVAGLVFVHDLPRQQAAGHYDPYSGVFWDVPAVYLGVDEGTMLKEAVATGDATARMTVDASIETAPTRTLVARLPGTSDQRIVVQSHTDGMNAVWDNGPIAILGLARYFASLPIECRPRTLEFVFTTAHLYLSKAGAERYAEILDEAYDEGTVAMAVALEHLGAKEYVARPRAAGPGSELVQTGESELFATFVTESPVLVDALLETVLAHDLRRTFVLRGADAPQAGFPPHRSYGGEGGPYHQHLIPTVAAITGPATLFKPAFGMEQLDAGLMRRQTIAFGDLVLRVDDLPREAIAGADTAYRAGRDLTS